VESNSDRNSTVLPAEAHTGAVPLTRSLLILADFYVNINVRQGLTPSQPMWSNPFSYIESQQ
jgi:hypothetical protein